MNKKNQLRNIRRNLIIKITKRDKINTKKREIKKILRTKKSPAKKNIRKNNKKERIPLKLINTRKKINYNNLHQNRKKNLD